jgi:hypothetical protein
MKTTILLIFIVATALAGCKSENNLPTGETKTVEYYKENMEERKSILAECKNNPGEYGNLPNCLNAKAAALADQHGDPSKYRF